MSQMSEEERRGYIRALLEEREGAVRLGKDDNVAQIDAELRRVGYDAAPKVKRAERRPRDPQAAESRDPEVKRVERKPTKHDNPGKD